MDAGAWKSGGETYGIRVGIGNRDAFFQRSWESIRVEIDGVVRVFKLTPGFWHKCPEFRDSGATVIKDWLGRNFGLPWPKGSPPHFELMPVSGDLFRLSASRNADRTR
jgi:hypothetical protein